MNNPGKILEKLNNIEDELLSNYYTDDEYREMLYTAGVSERDYKILQTALPEYIKRAKQFSKRNLNDYALKQLKSAQIISPNNYEVNLELANTYFNIWQKTNENSYKKLAEKHVEFCLNVNPSDDKAGDLFEMIKSGIKGTRLSKKNNATNFPRNFLNWLMQKDEKGEHSRLYLTLVVSIIAALLLFYVVPVIIIDNISAINAQKLSVELEKKYELINKYIQNDEIDKAQNELINLVHPSDEYSEIYPEGFSLTPYSYNEYWKIKRAELSNKIEKKKLENN